MAVATTTLLAAAALATAAVGTGVAIYGQQQQAKTQERAAKYNNELANAEARNRELETAEGIKRQRVQKRREMARLRNNLAGSGSLTTTGTPLAILGESSSNLELGIADAARASNMQAAAFRSQGKMGLWEASQARSAANISSVATGIQGVGSAVSGYYGYSRQGTF